VVTLWICCSKALLAAHATQAQSKMIEKRSKELHNQGHSKICAAARAADEQGLLDGDLNHVVRLEAVAVSVASSCRYSRQYK
jgi:hypothetical protein